MELPENIQLYIDKDGMVRARIFYEKEPCPDCGKMCSNRVTEYRMRTTPFLHWRHRCNYCKLYEHPVRETFSATGSELAQYYQEEKRLRSKNTK